MPMMSNDMPMRESPTEASDQSGDANEKVSAFVPKEFFRNTPKVGGYEKVKIVDVDPETGDAEIQCVYGEGEGSKDEGYEAAFDRAMPEETE